MTWDFLKLCIETFVARTLLREFRIRNLPWQDGLPAEEQAHDAAKLPWHGGTPVNEPMVRGFVHKVFALKVHLGIRYEEELDECEYIEEERQNRREIGPNGGRKEPLLRPMGKKKKKKKKNLES